MSETRPFSQHFDDHYWSISGGESEKSFIFLQGNNLSERFANAHSFTVAELGFGTGLTFRLTAQLWQQTAPREAQLTYIAYEQFPFSVEGLQTIHSNLPPHLNQPFQSGWNTRIHDTVTLNLFIGNAAEGIATQPAKANAWFLDGFTPSKNPQMWTPELIQSVADHTKPQGTFATYTVARNVRDSLTAAGFTWQKEKGHPPKQHMLAGCLI